MTIPELVQETKRNIRRRVCCRPGRLSRLFQHRNPFRTPQRAMEIDLARKWALGDVLMCTPALRELKRINPTCHLRFFTDYIPLVEGLDYIDEVHPFAARPPNTLILGYEHATPPRGALARIIGDLLGVNVTDVRPDCVIDPNLVERYRRSLQTMPKPHVVILRRASRFTPNKDWPQSHWDEVVANVCRFGTAIEIGAQTGEFSLTGGSYLDLRGKTSIPELAAIISVADLYVGPVSGPMHIAAAAAIPRVVIYGGFEHPIGYKGYEGVGERRMQVSLYSPVQCAPCWKTDECPYERKCLSMIKPRQVIAAVRELLEITTAS